MPVVQWIERNVADVEVGGSTPSGHAMPNIMDAEKVLRSHRFDPEMVNIDGLSKPGFRWYIDCLVDGRLEDLEVGEIDREMYFSLNRWKDTVKTIKEFRGYYYDMDFSGEVPIEEILSGGVA